jgi:quercetin dioxygenase-like cupin family protein
MWTTCLHVWSRSVIFRAGGRAPTVAAGELIVLEAAIAHEVYAVEGSVVLLTSRKEEPREPAR